MDEKIIKIIAKSLEVSESEITTDLVIGDIPEWDSLHHIMLLKNLETEFNIHFQLADVAELEDVSDLIALVKDLAE